MESLERLVTRDKKKDFLFHLNFLLYYEVYDNDREIKLHVYNAQDLTLSRKLKLLKHGFNKLAKMLQDNAKFSKIEKITGTSWIITEHPKLMQGLGFTLKDGTEESEKHKQDYKTQKKRSIYLKKAFVEPSYAEISAQDFIARFSKIDAKD